MIAAWTGLKALMGRILGSRKMIVNVIALAVFIASFLAPELGDRIEKLGGYGALILLVLTANGTVELGDLVKAWAERGQTAQEALDNITAELKPVVTSTTSINSGGGTTITATYPPVPPAAPVEVPPQG